MKKFAIIFLMLGILGMLFLGLGEQSAMSNQQYLRIHIRANSNTQLDQGVKYQVKDAVVDFMIPHLANCQNKQDATQVVANNLANIEHVATTILQQNGFCYVAHARLATENFPARTYQNLTLDSGFYDALILELGSGTGDNWWCVVYPPLCFVNGSAAVSGFKSRILEIINSVI